MSAKITIATHLLNGRRVGKIADLKTLGNDETITEAIKYGYVVGKKEQIAANVKGVLRAMSDGISKDGDGRKIDAIFSLQPSVRGKLADVTDDVDKTKLSVTANARMLKDLQVDSSDWTFVIEGATGNLVLNAISTGEKTGEIVVGEAVHINGFGLRLGDGDSVKWSVKDTDKSGTVPAALLESDMTRITVAGAALAELADAEYNGKTIVWSLAVGNNRAVKSALLVVA